jgi:hypothetical protein
VHVNIVTAVGLRVESVSGRIENALNRGSAWPLKERKKRGR